MSRVDNALLLRDTIQKIVNDKIGKTNPGASYATVTGFNPALGIITVRYPGDDVDIEIPAGSIYPSEPGQIVRIEGPTGSRVVADVKGENLTEVKARTAQETADGKNTVNYGETPPEGTDHKDGDIWFDEGNSNMPHVWKDGNWVSIEDLRVSAIAEAQDELRQDLDTVVANGVGTKSFYKPTEPTAAESKEGDLWFDTSAGGNNELHTYVNGAWVSAADARIAALKDAQTQMTGDISAAQQKADEAFQDAADADSKAVTAKSAADAAADAAASAAGIANGKGKVLVQSTTPGAADRNAQTLWIDTTGGANTPKRWVSGTTWSAVTDKAATDAASAAATAQTKANEAKSAADAAQSAATNAQTAASNAQSTATEALTSANSKNAVTRSTSNPSSSYTGRVDDIWWKMSTLSSGGRVIAQYRWNGTAWLTETIDNAVIANLDAAKITTGYLDAARIKANTLNADTVLINGSLGSIILRDGAITTPKIAVGAITAESGVVASLDAGKITVGTLDVARLAANSITADKVLLGSGANLAPWDQVRRGETVTPHATFSSGDADGTLALAPGSSSIGVPNHMAWTRSSTQNGSYGPILLAGPNDARIPAEPGGSYTVNVTTYSTDLTCQSRLRIYWYGERASDGSYPYGGSVFSPLGEYFLSPTPTRRSISVKLPDNARYIVPMVTTDGDLVDRRGTVHIVDWELKERIGSTLIEPGAITTENLATGAITAESGVIGSLDASKITVGKLSGARLEADAINGMQIIGATIATSTTFPRVQMDNAGLHVYKSSSVRSFFADAATGDLSIIGKLFTGTEGASRVALDPTLWSSLPVYDGAGGIAGYASGAGIRVGVNASNSADLYHAALSNGATSGVFRSSSGRSVVSVEDMPLSGGRFLSSVEIFGEVSEGKTYARFGDGIYATYNDKADSSYWSKFSLYKNSSRLDTNSGDYSSSVNAGSSFARLSVSKNDNEFYSSVTAGSSSIDLFTSYNPRGSTAVVQLVNGTSTTDGYVNVSGENVNPLRIDYLGTGASWIVPFRKSGTSWGYIGSTGAMGVDDFGVQSASGKDLVMRSPSGGEVRITAARSPRVQAPTIADATGSTSSNAASVYIRPTTGVMFISSSSERYKQDIEDAAGMPSILDVKTRSWVDNADVAESAALAEFRAEVGEGPVSRDLADAEPQPPRYFGAIAEEVDELGLSDLVRYDAFGRPDGLQYEMFGVALIPEVRKLRDRIAELEAKLDTPS